MPPRRRDALVRAARAAAVLVALLLPIPGLGRAYAGLFTTLASPILSAVASSEESIVSLERPPEGDEHHAWYTMMFVRDRASGALQHRGAADLRRSGYLQIAIFLAACAAFPLRERRRFAAAAGAGALALAWLGWLPVFMYLALKGVLHLGPVGYVVLTIVERSLVAAPGMAYVVPIALWALEVHMLEREHGWPALFRPAAVKM